MRLPPEFEPDDENADDESMCRLICALLVTGCFFGAIITILLFLR